MMDPIKKLEEDIKKSGLPTEIKVSNILRKDNWIVINQYPYLDQKNQKIRTLDIIAGKIFKNGKACILFIECKKSKEHQWVFYTSRGFVESLGFLIRIIEVAIQRAQANKEIKRLLFSIHPSYKVDYGIGLISYTPFKRKDDFNVARCQLLSAIESKGIIPNENLIIYPTIIFDGKIFSVQIDEDKPNLDEINNLVFVSPMFSEITPILIDVITLNYLSFHLEKLNDELGPSYSIVEIEKLITEGLEKLQDFARILKDTTKKLETSHLT